MSLPLARFTARVIPPRALQYKEESDQADKKCSGCAQFEGKKYGDCGACKLFTGAVNPNGVCLSYAPIAAK